MLACWLRMQVDLGWGEVEQKRGVVDTGGIFEYIVE